MPASDTFLWTDPQPLVDEGIPADVALASVVNASWFLWMLAGQGLHTNGRLRELYQFVPGGRPRIKLTQQPVLDVTAVVVVKKWSADEVALTRYDDWTLVGSTIDFRSITTMGSGSWIPDWIQPLGYTTRDDMVRVEYQVGSNLPVVSSTVALTLAREYAKASMGQKCNLPDRLASVTRQGISWTVLDPGEFLDKGRTGVMSVDSWLAAVNPRGNRQTARLFDPATPRLISAVWYEDPSDVHTITNIDGSKTYSGHGAPPDTLHGGTNDVYIDMDTGTSYKVTPA